MGTIQQNIAEVEKRVADAAARAGRASDTAAAAQARTHMGSGHPAGAGVPIADGVPVVAAHA